MIEAVIFDLDGVIFDSHAATVWYFQETLRHFGYPVPEPEAFQSLLGLKTRDIVRGLLPKVSEEEVDRVFDYSKEMSVKAVPRITLFPRAREVLEELDLKYKLAAVTSRAKRTVEILFEQYDLVPLFDQVVDREDVQKHKPDPEGVRIVLGRLGVSSQRAVFVGDSGEDVEVAKNAEMPSVLVHGRDDSLKPIYRLGKIADLPGLLRDIDR